MTVSTSSRPINRRRAGALFAACAATLMLAGPASAQKWPERTVTVIVPYAPGGFTDTLARIASNYLSDQLGQSFVVDNRPGAGGGIGTTSFLRSEPDGYTLMFGSATQPSLAPLTRKITYNAEDLQPVTIFGRIPFLLAVRADFPADDVKSLIAHAKTVKKGLNAAVTGSGTTSHLITTSFAHRAGIDVVTVPYKGSAPAATAVLQGDVDMAWAGVSEIKPLLEGGKVKALAISAPERLPALKDIPAVGETLDGFHLQTWNGFFAVPGTPKEVINTVSELLRKAVADPKIEKQLRDLGFDPAATTPEEMGKIMEGDKAFYAEAVKNAGLKQQ